MGAALSKTYRGETEVYEYSETSNHMNTMEPTIDITSNDTIGVEESSISKTKNDTNTIEASLGVTSNDTNKVVSTIGEQSSDTNTMEVGENSSDTVKGLVDEVKDLLDCDNIIIPILELVAMAANEREQWLKKKIFGDLVSEIEQKRKVTSLLTDACQMAARLYTTRDELGRSQAYIISLEQRLEVVEKLFQSTFIEIRNIPVKNHETKINLVKLVLLMGTKIEMNIQKNDIKNIFLTKETDADRGIIVDFSTVMLKQHFLRMYNKHNHNKKKLTTHHLDLLNGPATPIVVVDKPPIERFPTEQF